MKIKDLILNPVFTIGDDATIKDAVKIFDEKKCNTLVVTRNNKPVGLITERDILKKVILFYSNPQKIKAKQIMSKPLYFGTPDMELSEAAKIMLYKKIDSLPILFKEKIIGIVYLSDVVRCKDSVKQFKGFVESATSSEMKQAIDVYFALDSLCKKCPLMIEQGYPKKCRKSECMWWIGEDCAVAILSKSINNNKKSALITNF